MVDHHSPALEDLWDQLLSRRAERVLAGYASLTSAEQKAVVVHLQRMASEPGWHPEQRASARAALAALDQLLAP